MPSKTFKEISLQYIPSNGLDPVEVYVHVKKNGDITHAYMYASDAEDVPWAVKPLSRNPMFVGLTQAWADKYQKPLRAALIDAYKSHDDTIVFSDK